MIKTHEFNTQWWGKPVGIVTEPRFFEQPESERRALLQPFEWVEFKMPLEECPVETVMLHRAGFMQVDTQINYRLSLVNLQEPESLAGLDVEFADERPFDIGEDEIKSFEHERYFKLPGITAEMVNRRYVLWCRQHLREHASECLRVVYEGQVQGWYLGATTEAPGLNRPLPPSRARSTIPASAVFSSRPARRLSSPANSRAAGQAARAIRPGINSCWIRSNFVNYQE